MKLIMITTDMQLSVHEFPGGSYEEQNRFLRDLIGNGCSTYEHVMPRRLYSELHMLNSPTYVPGQCVSMLVDEDGLLKENEPNPIGSYIYEIDMHGHPIMGNIIFIGEVYGRDGIDFCGIEDSVFEKLKQQLTDMISHMKEMKEVLGV